MSMKDFVNTVPGVYQLKENEYLSYMLNTEAKKKVLILGNSILRHGPKAELGWYGDWGMAASCVDKDFVHVLYRKMAEYFGAVSMCIAQAGAWEVTDSANKKEKLMESYAAAAEFDADLIIIRLGENVDMSKTSISELAEDFRQMITFFGGDKENTQVIVTGQFWESPEKENAVQLACHGKGYHFVSLKDLGMDEKMTAMGLFEHAGVAGHPGDLGMQHIAERIMDKAKEIYSENNKIGRGIL